MIKNININRIGELLISINYEGSYSGDVNVYYGELPSLTMEDKKILGKMDSNEIVLKNPDPNKRFYYLLQLEDGSVYLSSERLVKLEGSNNFRDIGGYKTKDGRFVKWGKLYRSDQLSDLTFKDLEFVENLRLKSIVDFRSEAEASRAENKFIKGTKSYRLDPNAKVAQLAAGSLDVGEKKNKTTIELLKANEFNPDDYGDPRENMLKEYRKFINAPEAKKAYKELINIILNEENLPLVQHCRGGKDRTGFGVAIILLALGVCEEDIVSDYELTTMYRGERNKKQMDKYRQFTDDEKTLELLSTMQKSKAEYMEEAIREMKSTYGTVENYLNEVLDLDKEKIEKLKEQLLY